LGRPHIACSIHNDRYNKGKIIKRAPARKERSRETRDTRDAGKNKRYDIKRRRRNTLRIRLPRVRFELWKQCREEKKTKKSTKTRKHIRGIGKNLNKTSCAIAG